jgi:hypothetical protein
MIFGLPGLFDDLGPRLMAVGIGASALVLAGAAMLVAVWKRRSGKPNRVAVVAAFLFSLLGGCSILFAVGR